MDETIRRRLRELGGEGQDLRTWRAPDAVSAGWVGLALLSMDGQLQDSHRLRLFRALWAEDEDHELQERVAQLWDQDVIAFRQHALDLTLEDEVDEADLWYARRIVGQISEEMCRSYGALH